MNKQVRQYGTWASPISPKSLAAGLRLNDVQWDSDGSTLVWLEGRGALGTLVMRSGSEAARDLNPPELSVRARVGYGGGDFTVSHGIAYFAGPEGRLYRQSLAGGTARPITPAFGTAAAPRISPDGQWCIYVHSYERIDGLAVVDTGGELWPSRLASGTDFVMQPAWHPRGQFLAYVAWDHPQMPWDGTELRLIALEYDGRRAPFSAQVEMIAGDRTTAIFQPEFSPDGRYLAYVSDTTGWGQLYLYDLGGKTHTRLTQYEVEHAAPAWAQGLRMYGWAPDSRSLYFLRNERGVFSLWRCGLQPGSEARVSGLDHYTYLAQIAVSPRREAVALIAGASRIPSRIITFVPETAAVPEQLVDELATIQVLVEEDQSGETIHKRSSSESYSAEQLAVAQPMTWQGHDGETVHGFYYPPTSEQFEGTGAPPLIVSVHGGPTSQTVASYSSSAQFFASRGFAVLEVNYRGSTGYGKAYMNKLIGSWGLYDVEDSASGALHLVRQGLADRSKLVIMGGSAGGFTVLQSLIDKPGFYRAGVCLYGVSNQFLLALETHKFEERYLDSILGPLPEAAALYRERSPYLHANRIVDPLIVFQGDEDQVVPRNQSDGIVESLKARGIPHEYHVYAGEGHGWRKPETIEHYYTSAARFLQQHVVFA